MHFILRRFLPVISFLTLVAHGTIVTTFTDEDDGSLGGGTGISLREAVKYSTAGTTITFHPALSGQTIRLTLGQITIGQALTIDGSALSVPITISGDKTANGKTPDDTQIFRIYDQIVTLDSLTISGGASYSNSISGGAIYAVGHSVALTVHRCTFSGNHFVTDGAAIHFYGAYEAPETKLTVRNSTFTGNTATGYGGAIYAFGVVEIQNTTITGNKAFSGGGIAIYFNTTALIHHTTITGNTATSKGGCAHNSGSLTIRNSIIGGNTAPISPGIHGSFVSDQNISSGSPLLAPLGDYGGLTQTLPPLPGSPAINAGTTKVNSLFPPLTTDQRGFPRVSTPDIGAVEYQGTADIVRFWKLDSDGDGSTYGSEQALGTDPFVSDPASTRNLTAPVFNASGHAVLSFGIAPAAAGTRWILKRSTDLVTFSEIYRTDGTSDTASTGITFLRTATRITVTDANPPPGGGFYRFEAILEP